MPQARHKNEAAGSENPSQAFSELLAQWVELYAGNYPKEPTQETVLAYKIGLSGLNLKWLHEAFLHCLKNCTFCPTVAEIRNAYMLKAEDDNLTHYALPEGPTMTAAERGEIGEMFTKVAEKLKIVR